ncbi:hypothetical protein FB567DRAFT_544288 [Paraphoma chrysanthemicola]|uniref:Uncharacterized protein n=1 Tax=Paraphoma chrysanthemicola TaxID=798071 RepID=A0A8K0RJA1_9PLEO|nr:hypothetical protein FB567DRAFT_544288 [Paraphoma chrysanthemicola]
MSLKIPTSNAGIDKTSPPSWDETSTMFPSPERPVVNFDYKWMQNLFNRSNYSFTGLYLSHCSKLAIKRGEVYDRTQDPEWRKAFPIFLKQGWGFWFIFVGYSYRQKDTNLTNWDLRLDKLDKRVAQELGRNDARLLKRRAAEVGGYDAQGAVVYIDNEDQPSDHPWSERILDYYEALIENCRISGQGPDDGPAVRPGFYARGQVMPRILQAQSTRDIWFWVCSPWGRDRPKVAFPMIYDTRTRPGEIISPIKFYPLDALEDHETKRTYIPLGRQWVLWEGGGRCLLAPDHGSRPWLKRCTIIDFNSALVRDPRYPIAEPRIAVLGNVQLRTGYSKKSLSMNIEQVYQVTVSVPVPYDPDKKSPELFEPEAPICLIQSSTPDYQGPEIFTLNKSGMPVLLGADATGVPEAPYKWRFPVPLIDSRVPVRLRRNRAMAVAHAPDLTNGFESTHLFFVAENHQLLCVRRNNTKWSDPMPVANEERLHPFSSIAATQQAVDSISVFFLDSNGYLCHSALPGSEKVWPGKDFTQLKKSPTLLLETPLVAVSPSTTQTLVFGIGKDFFIHMAVGKLTDDKGNWTWTEPVKIEGQKDEDYKVFSKSGLDAIVKHDVRREAKSGSPVERRVDHVSVYIAGVNEVNVPFVFELKSSGAKWTLQDSTEAKKYLPTNDLPLGGKVAPSKSAKGWNCNPFGDVKLSLLDGTVAIWIPAVRSKEGKENLTETGMLMRKPFVARDSYWIEVKYGEIFG